MSAPIAHDLETKQRSQDVLLNESVAFQCMLLSEKVLLGLQKNGFRKPSPIQLKAIPLGRCGFDLIIQSKSGTGKTAVFSIVALETLDKEKPDLQALILASTREIAVQIQEVIKAIGNEFDSLKVESFIGGFPEADDVEKARNCQIAVGAPGRVKSLIRKGILKTNTVKLFVLDEADKLMENSFQGDINEIYEMLPVRKQMIASSATYPDGLEKFLSNYMQSPTFINAELGNPMLLGLKQFVRIVKGHSNTVQLMKVKNEELLNILSTVSFTQCLVFSNYQTRAQSISNTINQKGWDSVYISGAQSQNERLEAMKDLKNFKCRILLSTDLTARGIDAANVDLVVNYDVPVDPMTYLHRMGRAGRYGSPGLCITLAADGNEVKQLQKILGVIGGTDLTVPKIPEANGNPLDLWKADLASLEVLRGCEVEKFDKAEISEQVTKLKQNNSKSRRDDSKMKKALNKNKKSKITTDDGTSNETMSSVVEDKEECVKNILESLASGNFDFSKADQIGNNSGSAESSKGSDLKQEMLTSVECKKRKRASNSNATSPSSISSTTKNENIYYKNKGMYDIFQILSNLNGTIDDEKVDDIERYLNIIKKENTDTIAKLLKKSKDSTPEELLKHIHLHIEAFKNDACESESASERSKTPQEDVLEDIFSHAYQYAIGGSTHWLEKLPESTVQEFRDMSIRKDSESDDYEDEDCYEMEEEDEYEFNGAMHVEINEEEERRNQPSLEWVPVNSIADTADKLPIDKSSKEHFEACFNQCSEYLWQYGLTFEDVSSFDEWFLQWQHQLHSVRQYVAQNLYVKEMNEYQQFKKQK